MAVFFTADLHFGHGNIIRHCSRPFSCAAEMDQRLIDNINRVAGSNDQLWILGDVAFKGHRIAADYLRLIRARKHLVIGNHDPSRIQRLDVWESVQHYKELSLGKQLLVLSHYPFASWNKAHHGSWHLHGHSHGNMPAIPGRCDVGVDCWDYQPVTLDEIAARLAEVTAAPLAQ